MCIKIRKSEVQVISSINNFELKGHVIMRMHVTDSVHEEAHKSLATV